MNRERIVATSEPRSWESHYVIETKGALGWERLIGTYPNQAAALAFAKAFGGSIWRVIEVSPDD